MTTAERISDHMDGQGVDDVRTAMAAELAELGNDVGNLSKSASDDAKDRHTLLANPAGALGQLEKLSIWLAGVQDACPPRPLDRVSVVIFAADHGVARTGVSAFRPESTAHMVTNVVRGGAAVNAMARLQNVKVRVIDIAVDRDWETLEGGSTIPSEVTAFKVRRSSNNVAVESALTYDEAMRAFRAGQALADDEVDRGVDLLIPGALGAGATTPAATITAVLTGSEVAAMVGRGSGINDATWMVKCAAVRDSARRGRGATGDMIELLAACGGADLAAMTGFLVQAAARRTPVLLDGVVSCAAALVAQRIAHRSRVWWQASHRDGEPAQSAALERLRLAPIMDLDIRLGDGSGALMALPVLRAAQATLADTATFEEAGIDQPAGPRASQV